MNGYIDSEKEFYDAFAHDENGDAFIEEINADEHSDLGPDPDIVAMIEAERKKNVAA